MEKINIDIPKGYEFAGIDNDKQQIVFTKIQSQYPKDYVECYEVLVGRKPAPHEVSFDKMEICLLSDSYDAQSIDFQTPQLFQLNGLFRLLMCRNAYWKLAGKEMGLDKPWKYDLSKDEFVYAIVYQHGYINKCEIRYRNHILAFPTEEMRNTFYENFKDLIEQCKELL